MIKMVPRRDDVAALLYKKEAPYMPDARMYSGRIDLDAAKE